MKTLLICPKAGTFYGIWRKMEWQEYSGVETVTAAEKRLFQIQSEFEAEESIFAHKWVIVLRNLPVAKTNFPKFMDIYQATPLGFDDDLYFRVSITVNGENCSLYNNGERVIDYKVIEESEINLDEYEYVDSFLNKKVEENQIDLSKNLSPDEKDIILSYQLDGLDKSQAIAMFYNNSCFVGNPKQGYYRKK